ncbi:unnamed protein product [Macrosiphum euphorbiae]|uniref:UDP-N-acetylglucosamine--peptide N-acetylglucosaminyltransferase SPINDLY n=1 Tax=Macrosiphum euphorbiae TaxID=13131 RepID=A0AAV0WL70_9HEMI|nr:unnamed protein product [Macrosiphum euphorbiae]
MNSSSSYVFFPKHSDSEAPISVITDILSEIDSLKFKNISDEFGKLGFTKVKDLAGATVGKARSVKLPGDTLKHLYEAMKIYSEVLDKLLKSAKSEIKNGNFIEAQKICKVLLTHKPKDLNVLLVNANSFFECEKYDECLECLEKAKSVNPNCSEVLLNMALVYQKKSENDLAKEYYFKACKIKPYSADAWTDYADFLNETNDLARAGFAYVRALSLQQESHEVRNKYGKLLLKLNKIKEAKNQFKMAHNSAKECPETLNYLADVYYKSGKFEKSILKYKQTLEIDPDRANACFHLGMAYIKRTEYQNASNAFKKGVALEPENKSYLKILAVTYCLLGDMELCAETYKKCLILEPEDFNLNLELALVYLNNIRNYHQASLYLEKCTQLNPDRIDVYQNLFTAYKKNKEPVKASDACMSIGDLYMEKDDYENAKSAFTCAAIMNPKNEYSHWKMGQTLYMLGQLDLALIKYKHTIAIKPNFPDAFYDMGVLFEERGLLEEAKVHYEKAIEISPNNHINARLKLNDILKKQTDLNNGITDNEMQ